LWAQAVTRRLYSAQVGTSWVLVEAGTVDLARREVGERLGFAHKPYLWERITVRPATADDVRRYSAIADAARANRAGDKVKKTTANALAKKAKAGTVIELFPDTPNEVA
jgi:hypothetical protein